MDDTGETGEFTRVLKLEFAAVPRFFDAFLYAHLRLNHLFIIWIPHLCVLLGSDKILLEIWHCC